MTFSYRRIGYGILLTGGLVALGNLACTTAHPPPSIARPLEQLVQIEEFITDVANKKSFNIIDTQSGKSFEVDAIASLYFINSQGETSTTYVKRADITGLGYVEIDEGGNKVKITPEHILNRYGNIIGSTKKEVWTDHEHTYQRLLKAAFKAAQEMNAKESKKAKELGDKVNR